MGKTWTKNQGFLIGLILVVTASVVVAYVVDFDDDVWLYKPSGQGKLLFWDDQTNYVSFRVHNLGANYNYVWPNATPTTASRLLRASPGDPSVMSWSNVFTPGTFVGLNQSNPQTQLHLSHEQASTNTIIESVRLDRTSSGSPSNGIGQEIAFYVEDAFGGTDKIAYLSSWISSSSRGNIALGTDVDGGQNYHDLIRAGDTWADVAFYDQDSGYYTTLNFTGLSENRIWTIDMSDGARRFDMAEDLFVEAGGGASRINQDVTADASPTFAGLTINGDIDLNNNALIDIGYIAFETGAVKPPWEEGLAFYDDDEKTIAVYNNEADITLQLGQEMFLRATNKSGSTILNGALVYIDGAQGSRPTIALAKADAAATCQVLAMATHDISDNATGFVTTNGLVHDVNTASITAGDAIYLSAATAGAYTDTAPTAPSFVIQVGRCIFENSTSGLIYIDIGPTAVCGTMVINDLDINVDLDVAGDITADDITGTSLTLNLTNDYLLTERGAGQSLAIQNQASNIASRLELFTKDGDRLDNAAVIVYAKGLPGSVTNSEFVRLAYLAVPDGGPKFVLNTGASGGETVHPLSIYTGANTSQLVLAIDGTVSMASDLTINDLIIGDNRFIGSASDTDAMQIEADGDVVFTQEVSATIFNATFVVGTGDIDTFMAFSDDVIDFQAGGLDLLRLTESGRGQDEVVVNEDGGDIDFRVEGVGQANLIQTDATNARVGIGIASPGALLHAAGNVIIGAGTAGVDYTLTFDGENSDGILAWMEDEDYFKFSDDVLLDTGIMYLKETTTPTPIADHAVIYTTSDNELFFQDGAGTNHLLHGDSFSNIWFSSPSTVEVTISAQNVFTKIDSFTAIGHEDDLLNLVGNITTNTLTLSAIAEGEYEVSYHGSVTATGGADKLMMFVFGITLATPKDITNVTDDTVTPIVITSVAHNLDNGDMVEIAGVLGNTAANGSFFVSSKANDTFEIIALDNSATTGNGDYNEGSPTGDVTIWYPGNMMIRRAVRGADLGAISATGLHIFANSDVLSLYVANLSGTTNLTVATVSFDADRIGD